MLPLHVRQARVGTIILPILAMATCTSAWSVPKSSMARPTRSSERRSDCHDFRNIARAWITSSSQLGMLPIDPANVIVVAADTQHPDHIVSSALDMLSSLTLAKANSVALSVTPNQSIAPLLETIRSSISNVDVTNNSNNGGGAANNMIEVIPDMYSMPGGAPRSGNPFLAGTFREMYDMAIQPHNARLVEYNTIKNADGSMRVPARELDVVARYADLLNRVPLIAALYALVDFYFINADEDVALSELLSYDGSDEEEEEEEYGNNIEAIMDVENRVLMQRIVGLLSIVFVTIAWSLMSYHPVPFNEL